MEPVKIGVIGCGVIAQHHLKAALKSPQQIQITAVADIRIQAAQATAQTFNVKTVYDNADALLADPNVEAVVLAMPTCERTKLVLKAFAQGKHVLTEKPVAMNANEVERMIKARGRLTAACCSSRVRFPEPAKAATEFVASGALGDLRLIRCRSVSPIGKLPQIPPAAWRLIKKLNGGGILVNWGCYDLDYILGITGWSLKPKGVFAQTWPIAKEFLPYVASGTDAETHFAAFIYCERGIVITFERGEYMPSQPEDAWQIIGSKGTLHLAMTTSPSAKIIFDSVDAEQGVVSKTIWEETQPSVAPLSPIQDFAVAILEDRPPKTTLEQALIIQKITDAIYASAGRKTAVIISA